jgi:cytochrome oxidase assembly protein ShyY1
MLAGLSLLLVLGTWQLLRFQDKSEFENLRDSRLEQPAQKVEAGAVTSPDINYRVVKLSGEFVPDHIFLFKYRVRDSVPGYWMGQIFRGEGGDQVLVNRGWIPYEDGESIARELRAEGKQELEGLVFTPEQIIPDDTTRATLTPGEVPDVTFWNSYDIQGIYDALEIDRAKPTIVIAAAQHSGDPHPIASFDYVVAPYLTAEKHLGYCVTWYTLAAALILMWIAYGFGYLGSYASRAGGASATNA